MTTGTPATVSLAEEMVSNVGNSVDPKLPAHGNARKRRSTVARTDLTSSVRDEIRDLYANGVPVREIQGRYQLPNGTFYRIIEDLPKRGFQSTLNRARGPRAMTSNDEVPRVDRSAFHDEEAGTPRTYQVIYSVIRCEQIVVASMEEAFAEVRRRAGPNIDIVSIQRVQRTSNSK